MAPADILSPAGSATYSSNTLYVGDGTWDSTKNDFLLPNLMGLNFDTMRYNGMGNRFASMPGYKTLILGHGVIAAMIFLFIVPAAIMIARFYGRNPRWALKLHIYLQIITVALTTVIFVLGFVAVGPERSLTNPHHGIGLAIYVLVLVQAIGGAWIHRTEKGKIVRRLPLKLVLHEWMGRAIALLGIAQVPLGLTLYGSPKVLFILYTLWMTFLLIWYFILSFRARAPIGGLTREESIHHGETVVSEQTGSRLGKLVAPLAAGAGLAALLGRNRNRSRSRSRSRSRVEEVIPSRHGSRRGSRSRRDSGSYTEEEKYEERKSSGGIMDKLLKGAAVLGAGALAKSWFDRKKRRREDEEYSSVAPDTPSRRNRPQRRPGESEYSDESTEVTRLEAGRPPRAGVLPGPVNPTETATALTGETRPVTPRPLRAHGRSRVDSFDSDYYSSTMSPSRRPQEGHGIRNGLLAGLGLGWFAKKLKDRRDAKEQRRLEEEEDRRYEEERMARKGTRGPKFTGDGHPSGRRHGRRDSVTESSYLSSILDDPHVRPAGSSIPAVPVPLGSAGAPSTIPPSRSETAAIPPAPSDPQGVLHPESESEAYVSAGGGMHRRRSSRRRAEGEAAAAAAAASGLAAAEAERKRRERDHSQSAVASPPVSVKVKVHGDKDRNVTLRRLTQEEAAAEREARKGHRRKRADSASSQSGTDTGTNRRRYRRDTSQRRAEEIAAEKGAEASVVGGPPPSMRPLTPPEPPYAGGKKPKDSAYYSGRPPTSIGSAGSPESHGTWSELTPSGVAGSAAEDAAARRRRRRQERNQRQNPSTVDYT